MKIQNLAIQILNQFKICPLQQSYRSYLQILNVQQIYRQNYYTVVQEFCLLYKFVTNILRILC